MSRAITASRLFDGHNWLERHCLLLEGEAITALAALEDLPQGTPLQDLGDGTLAPGFIDLQVNGGGGVLFNNLPTVEGIGRITAAHRATGTTGMLPTLISDTPEVHQAGLDAAERARAQGNSSVLGLHIEGPFFDLYKRGTHKAEMIRPMEDRDLQWLCSSRELPLVLTLAPEHARSGQIKQLTDAGVRVCAGHTNANYQQVKQALAEGLSGFTHLFNAMSPLTAREPGVVGAALEDSNSWAGLIADGHHVHATSIRLAHRVKASGKLCLVTDAMATVGSDSDSFEIYGEIIREQDGKLINAEGVLAGSAIGMIDGVRYCHQVVGLELGECLRMASLYPAQFLDQADELGQLSSGARADLVFFDSNFIVGHTWVAGEHAEHRNES